MKMMWYLIVVRGTGATCIAARNTNRRYIGFEIDEMYYNIAKERINLDM